MSEERVLFDRKLLRARRARFAHEIESHQFLLEHVGREIAERVAIMLRPFPLALDLGAYRGLLGRKVAELPSVGEMIYAESAEALPQTPDEHEHRQQEHAPPPGLLLAGGPVQGTLNCDRRHPLGSNTVVRLALWDWTRSEPSRSSRSSGS